MVNQEMLQSIFSYDPETGLVTRNKTTAHNAKAGDIVGTNSRGYLVVWVDNKLHFLHRIIWFMVHGKFPDHMIDHIDGDKSNNRISNLRDVTNAINTQNVKKARNCNLSTKLLGSTYCKKSGKYKAQIKINGKNKYLGEYETPEMAHDVYMEAKKSIHTGAML